MQGRNGRTTLTLHSGDHLCSPRAATDVAHAVAPRPERHFTTQ